MSSQFDGYQKYGSKVHVLVAAVWMDAIDHVKSTPLDLLIRILAGLAVLIKHSINLWPIVFEIIGSLRLRLGIGSLLTWELKDAEGP